MNAVPEFGWYGQCLCCIAVAPSGPRCALFKICAHISFHWWYVWFEQCPTWSFLAYWRIIFVDKLFISTLLSLVWHCSVIHGFLFPLIISLVCEALNCMPPRSKGTNCISATFLTLSLLGNCSAWHNIFVVVVVCSYFYNLHAHKNNISAS